MRRASGLLLLAAACTEPSVDGLGEAVDAGATPRDAGAPPPGDAGSEEDAAPDAGPPDVGPPDTGAVDLGPPARSLVRRPIFGSLPVANLVMNPLFDTQSALRPVRFDGSTPARLVTHESPTGTPVARLDGGEPMVLFVQGSSGPVEASIWIGRRPQDGPPAARVALTGLGEQDFQVGAELSGAPETDRAIGDVTWRRFSGVIEARLLGNGFLLVDPPEGTTFAAGPVVARQARQVAGRSTLAPAAPLRLPPATRAGLERVLERFREESRRRLAPAPLELRALPPLPLGEE
jgi:hypothetical protein